MEVFYLAHMYELGHLVSLCEKVFCSLMVGHTLLPCIPHYSLIQDETNCLDILEIAARHDRPALKNACEHFISYNFDSIADTSTFKKLPKKQKEDLQATKKTLVL